MKVQRYELYFAETENGDYVKYSEYKKLEARIAELEKQLNDFQDVGYVIECKDKRIAELEETIKKSNISEHMVKCFCGTTTDTRQFWRCTRCGNQISSPR